MKNSQRILSLIIVLALLAACAPVPTPAPTATPTLTPAPTATPTPTVTPTETVIPTIEASATPEAVYVYPEFPVSNENWNGTVQAWLNPEYSMNGMFRLSEGANEEITKIILDALDYNSNDMLNSEFLGGASGNATLEQIKAYLLANNGKLPGFMGLPVSERLRKQQVKFETGQQIDLNKAIELRFTMYGEDNQIPPEKELRAIWYILDNNNAYLFEISPDGHLILTIQRIQGQISFQGRDLMIRHALLAMLRFQTPYARNSLAIISSGEEITTNTLRSRMEKFPIVELNGE